MITEKLNNINYKRGKKRIIKKRDISMMITNLIDITNKKIWIDLAILF